MSGGRQVVKRLVNAILRPLHLELRGTTAESNELNRLGELERRGWFAGGQFPLEQRLDSVMAGEILAASRQFRDVFATWSDPSRNSHGFTLANDYYTSPDAEVLYTMLRLLKPRRIVEVGSGNSTRVMRMAGADTEIICVDPHPRREVAAVCNRFIEDRVENMAPAFFRDNLSSGDVLFIDSSHEVKAGGDTPFLYLRVLPELAPGVIVHVHDIFLPFEYPLEWIVENRWPWNEQYLVAAILLFGQRFEVLWAGHHLQRTRADFRDFFPEGVASSLWLRVAGEGGAR